MYEELEYEFSEFKRDFNDGNLVLGRYFDEDDYEDEYSHNQIDEFQTKFIKKLKNICIKKHQINMLLQADGVYSL